MGTGVCSIYMAVIVPSSVHEILAYSYANNNQIQPVV